MRESRSTLFILSKQNDDLIVMQNVCLSFDKINVIIACCEDIYDRHGIKKSYNGHCDPYKVVIIVFDIKSCSFSVVKSKLTNSTAISCIGKIYNLFAPLRNHVTSL